MAPYLSAREKSGILDVINAVYDFEDRDALLTFFFKKLEWLIGARGGAFCPAPEVAYNNQHVKPQGAYLYHSPRELMDIFVRKYVQFSPFVTTGFIRKVKNQAALPSDLMALSSLRKNKYYTEWLKIAGIRPPLVATLAAHGDEIGVLCVERAIQSPPFTERQKATLNHILPHLARAVHQCIHSDVLPDVSQLALTGRQEEIVKLIIRARSTREIAKRFHITEQTVRDHLRTVFKKAAVKSRNELTSKILGRAYSRPVDFHKP